jgi:hypothetical protein
MKTAKYIVCIDYKACYKPLTLEYAPLTDGNLLNAMVEAEGFMNENVYLITVMEQKSSKALKGYKGHRAVTYADILTNRGNGWHITDEAHCETAFERECYFAPDGEFSY